MPPKRKNTDADAAPAPATGTRRSSRGKGAASSTATLDVSSESIEVPAKKKARTSKGGTSLDASSKPKADKPTKAAPKTKAKTSESKEATTKPSARKDDLNPSTYTPQRVQSFFEPYIDEDTLDPKSYDEPGISPEGLMKLCEVSEMPLEGARPLILAWVCGCKKLMHIAKSEFTKGMTQYLIDTPAKLGLLAHDIEHLLLVPSSSKTIDVTSSPSDPYNKKQLRNLGAGNRLNATKEFYNFIFDLAKGGQRNIDIDTAVAFWSVTLKPLYPLVGDLLDFIAEANGTDSNEENPKMVYKGITKDQWKMTWSFMTTVDSNLNDYNVDDGWPTLLDDFVAWKTKTT